MQSESAATPSRVTYEDAPSPTMHLRSRCEWRAPTGHRCELEPHGDAIPHRVTLDDGGLLVTHGHTPAELSGNIAATLNRLSALEEKASALVTLANAQGETNAAVEARLDALERAAKRAGCDGACASGVDAENAHSALDVAGVYGADEDGNDLSLAARVELLVAARDARRAQAAAAVQAGEALRIECDELTAQVSKMECIQASSKADHDAIHAELDAAGILLETEAGGFPLGHRVRECIHQIVEAGDQLRDEQRERERLRAQLSVIGKGLIERERGGGGRARPCCERDHDKDGNCDKHPAAQPMPRKEP